MAQRWRNQWGEVDGIFYGHGRMLLVEVKAVREGWSDQPVSNSQKKRLEAVFNQLLERLPQYQLELWLAVVFPDDRIQFITDYFGS